MTYTDEQVQEMMQGGLAQRMQLAENGYNLDVLMYDEYWEVRYEVVIKGYRLDLLVHDEDWAIRREVARLGYGLETLANDEDAGVREIAQKYLGSTRHVVETNFGTYEGDLAVFTWESRYRIVSGCYETDDLAEWEEKCTQRLDKETAIKYAKAIQAIIKEEIK